MCTVQCNRNLMCTWYYISLQLYELGSGVLLCTFLFDSGLTRVTMDHGMNRLFVGGSSGAIWQVNLFLQVLVYNV